MAVIRAYRYDNRDIADGQTMSPPGDSYPGLTENQKIVESALRAYLKDGANIRANSLYAWEDEGFARRTWKHTRRRFLYELEIDEADILLRGDLNLYTEAAERVGRREPFDDLIRKYCAGETAGSPYAEPRREILASKAIAFRKLMSI